MSGLTASAPALIWAINSSIVFGFVNRISDIVYKGAEECDLDSQIDDNRKFWEELKSILNA